MIDPSVLIAAIGGMTTLLLAVVGVFGTILTGKLNQADYARKLMAADQKAEAAKVDNKLTGIHEITNSNLSKANARLDEAMMEIKGLTLLVAEMRSPTIAPPLVTPNGTPLAGATDVIESAKTTVLAAEKTVKAAVG